jgi:histidinol-phosphatase (PHP family)
MIANYHTHTVLCNHARGDEREYIEHAIKGGIKTLGFADHAPMPFPEGYYSGFRMRVEKTAEYFEKLQALKEEYKKDIRILIGFEAEYYPDLFDDFLKLVEPFAPDYLILGQHSLYNEQNAPAPSQATEDPAVLRQYVKQVLEGLETGKFIYQSHPDMMNFVGDKDLYTREMTTLCEYCKEHGFPLEINLLGIMDNRYYPREDFWKIAAKVGNTAILGCDAHIPEALSNKELHQKGKDWADRFGLKLIEELDI